MSYRLIWDLPTRIFHWVLAGGFFAAAFLALSAGDDSPLFPYHAIIGLVIAMAVVLRVIWGG
jgi:cytochrome b